MATITAGQTDTPLSLSVNPYQAPSSSPSYMDSFYANSMGTNQAGTPSLNTAPQPPSTLTTAPSYNSSGFQTTPTTATPAPTTASAPAPTGSGTSMPAPTTASAPSPYNGSNGPSSYNDAQFNDWWWSQQPAAVQALRNMPQGQDRQQAAIALAQQGYSIPGAIAGWGWDPSAVFTQAGQYGYTWLPGVGQAPVQMAPGLSMPGNLKEYNPSMAPQGSVQVPTSLVQAPLGSGYSSAQEWMNSQGGVKGGLQVGNAAGNNVYYAGTPSGYVGAGAAPGSSFASYNNLQNPYGSNGMGISNSQIPAQSLQGGSGPPVNLAPNQGTQTPTGQTQGSNSNSLDPSVLALLALLAGQHSGSQYQQTTNPYGYTGWTPIGGGAGINPYGIVGGGFGSQNTSQSLNSVLGLLAQLTGQGSGLANYGYGY